MIKVFDCFEAFKPMKVKLLDGSEGLSSIMSTTAQ